MDAAVVAAVAAAMLWGVGNLLVRGAPIDGPQLAFMRVLCGATLYTAVLLARGGRIRWDTLRRAIPGGVGFASSALLFFSAFKMTSLASASVIGSLQPLLLWPITIRTGDERPSITRLSMAAAAVGGTVLVVLGGRNSGHSSMSGDLLAVLGMIAGAGYFLGTKSARKVLSTGEYQSAALLVASVVTLPGALFLGSGWQPVSAGDLAWPVIMTLIPGTGHVLMTWAQSSLSVGFTSTVALLATVVASVGGVIFFDQSLGVVQVLGVVVVLASLAVLLRDTSDPVEPVFDEL